MQSQVDDDHVPYLSQFGPIKLIRRQIERSERNKLRQAVETPNLEREREKKKIDRVLVGIVVSAIHTTRHGLMNKLGVDVRSLHETTSRKIARQRAAKDLPRDFPVATCKWAGFITT